MKVFYHNDLDGRCAAYQVMKKFEKEEPEFFEMDYNRKFPMDIVQQGEPVVIVDFSVSPEEMTTLLTKTKDITWIDHHKTAIEKYIPFPEIEASLKGIRDTSYSGAFLAWLHYYGKPIPPDYKDVPEYIRLVNDHDTWKFEYGNRTRYFQLFMDTYYSEEWWQGFALCEMESGLEKIIEHGKEIFTYQKLKNRKEAEQLSFTVLFEGHRFLAINKPGNSSVLEDLFDPEKHDAFMCITMQPDKRFKVSLYTEKNIDLAVIALKYGGGGHKQACGFYTDDIHSITGAPEKKN